MSCSPRWCATSTCCSSGNPGRVDRLHRPRSHLDVPVREMPRYYEQLKAPRGQTDVLFITDALCRIDAELKNWFLGWKRQVQARLITLVVGSEPGDLAHISDEVHEVATLSATEEAVGRVLSL